MEKKVGFDEYLAMSTAVLGILEGSLTEEKTEKAKALSLSLTEKLFEASEEKDMDWQELIFAAIAIQASVLEAVSELLAEEEA